MPLSSVTTVGTNLSVRSETHSPARSSGIETCPELGVLEIVSLVAGNMGMAEYCLAVWARIVKSSLESYISPSPVGFQAASNRMNNKTPISQCPSS